MSRSVTDNDAFHNASPNEHFTFVSQKSAGLPHHQRGKKSPLVVYISDWRQLAKKKHNWNVVVRHPVRRPTNRVALVGHRAHCMSGRTFRTSQSRVVSSRTGSLHSTQTNAKAFSSSKDALERNRNGKRNWVNSSNFKASGKWASWRHRFQAKRKHFWQQFQLYRVRGTALSRVHASAGNLSHDLLLPFIINTVDKTQLHTQDGNSKSHNIQKVRIYTR